MGGAPHSSGHRRGEEGGVGSRGIREDGPEYQDLGVMDTLPTFKNWEDSHFRGGGGEH